MAAAHHCDRRFGGPEDAHMLVLGRMRDEHTAVAFGAVPIIGGNHKARQPAERRITGALAQFDLA